MNQRPESIRNLSPRQKQVVQLLADGNSFRQVAALIGISTNTVSKHAQAIQHKYRVATCYQMIAWAVALGDACVFIGHVERKNIVAG